METYTRTAVRHIPTGQYIGRALDHTTHRMEMSKTLRGSLKFADIGEASEWLLNAWCAPKDLKNYEYVTIEYQLNEKEAIPHVQEKRKHNRVG